MMSIGTFVNQPIATSVGKITGFLRQPPLMGQAAPGNGAVAQVTTLTWTSPSNSSTYTVTVTDPVGGGTEAVSITTDASATAAEASAAFLLAWRAKPLASGLMSITDGVGSNVLTAVTPNVAITLTLTANPGTALAQSATTAAAAATTYTFGKAVEVYYSSGIQRARIPVQPTRGTFTFTMTHAASSSYIYSVNVRNSATNDGAVLQVTVASGANVTATGAAAVAAFQANNVLGAGLITAAAGTPAGSDVAITVTLPTGWAFASASVPTVITGGAAASTTPVVGVTAGVIPNLALVYDPGDDSNDALGSGSRTTIRGGTAVPYVIAGAKILVPSAVAPSAGDAVLVDFGASGGLTPTASVTTVPLIGAGSRWEFTGQSQLIGTTTYYVCEAS
jgi:hypothetical protein